MPIITLITSNRILKNRYKQSTDNKPTISDHQLRTLLIVRVGQMYDKQVLAVRGIRYIL